MSEQAKTEMSCSSSGGGSGSSSYPLRRWWQSSRLFNQDVGLPPFLEPREPWWTSMDRLQRSLAACYIPAAPLFVPYISGSTHHPGQEISAEQYKWRVSLDVAHFSPSEISLSITDGFLEVAGKHEERPDEHGFIARCFTRKYRLPAEIDATKITSSLSVDGILTVEAPVPETSVPAPVIIPIKVEIAATAEKEEKEIEEEKEETPEKEAESVSAPEAPEFLPAEDQVEESPLEVHADEAAAGPEQHEERREQEEEEEKQEKEETHEQPAGESLPSASADDATESLQETSEQRESLESPETPETDTSKPLEQDQPAVEVEIQVMAGSGGAAEEPTQPEEPAQPEEPQSEQPEPEQGQSPLSEIPSQELQAPDIKQVHVQ